jgi:TetR/AcrR family transcriptional regulator, regulator of cefoperazone and chloramphenicol sensitivity
MGDPERAPGRAQLVDAALRLIGERGLKAATVRAVAEEAGVTPGLVVHHFGTKDRLAAEVDELVLARFTAALAVDTQSPSPDHAASAIAERLSETIGGDPDLRRYIRRAILEASPSGHAILTRLVELTVANLREQIPHPRLPSGRDLTWLAVQITIVNLAGTLLEPLLEPLLGRGPFTPAETRHRTTANLDFLAAALHHLTDRREHGPSPMNG